MLNVDQIVLVALLASIILSLAFTKFKGGVNKILFINLIIYPITAILMLFISSFVKENFVLALAIDFAYSLLIVVPITLIIIGLIYIVKKN